MAKYSSRDIDNALRLINKRLDTALKSLGSGSRVYNALSAKVLAYFPGSSFVKIDPKTSHVHISRSKEALSKLDATKVMKLKAYAAQNTVEAEKKQAREHAIKNMGIAKPKKNDIQRAAEELYDLTQEYEDAINYLYGYEGYAEVRQIMKDKIRSKGKKSYNDISDVINMADKYRASGLNPRPVYHEEYDDDDEEE